MTTYEELRRRHVADAKARLPEMVTRIDWSSDRLAKHRRTELQRLIRTARDLSPWHRKHLVDVNPYEVDEEILRELPVMTKDDLMDHFDEIVTDDRLRLEVVEAHLAARTAGDAYLFDRYHACASGGSTGRRGVFVYDWDGWAVCRFAFVRGEVRARRLDIGSSIHRTFSGSDGAVRHHFPATFPISCGQSTGTHLSDDLTIVEPVDADGRPVPFGVRSDKIYLTNLFNHAMPLIRYEVTDQLTFLDEGCPCGSVFQRIADPHGRLDDVQVSA